MSVLTEEQRAAFARDGYVVIPGVAGPGQVAQALRAINSWFTSGFDSQQLHIYASQSYAPEFTSSPAIAGLYGGRAAAAAEELVGTPLGSPSNGQIALRFPVPPGRSAAAGGPHIDGIASRYNGVPADGKVHSFTLLAAMMLSEVSGPGQGAFSVWPGSHRLMAGWFEEHGTAVPDADAFYHSMAEVAARTGGPVPVTGEPGDLVLAHYLLLHTVDAHVGPGIRYAVFFRLSSSLHAPAGTAVLTDAWAAWPAMRAPPGRGA